jgi:hypothetical protein
MVTLRLSLRARGLLWFGMLPATLGIRINGAALQRCGHSLWPASIPCRNGMLLAQWGGVRSGFAALSSRWARARLSALRLPRVATVGNV